MRRLLAKLERASVVDRVGDPAQSFVNTVLTSRRLRDALHGVWFGHPLHPALVQAPIGAWLSAAILDLLPGYRRAATALVAAGAASAVPAAVTGVNDWASLSREQRRVGVVHALANSTALTLYVASLTARLNGRHATGRRLAYTGLAIAGASAYLGGHMAYVQAAAVSHAAPVLPLVPEGWNDLGAEGEFPDGEPVVRQLGQAPVVVYRWGERFTVLLGRCAHRSGPLGEGTVIEVDGERCLQCPWHGSVYRLRDGLVVHGPAASDQPALRTRTVEGRLQAARP